MLRSLVKDTAIYGLSSMVGRMLNWLLTFVYVRVLLQEEFGQMTNLYAWTALALIVLTYGMETAFFRFANRHERPALVYGTTLIAVGTTSTLFALWGLWQSETLASWLGSPQEAIGLVRLLVAIVALDAFCAIPLGYLRYAQMPWRFMAVRMGFVGLTIGLTLLAFYGLPLVGIDPRETGGLYYILGINLIGNLVQLVMLAPTFARAEWRLDLTLLGQMLRYAWPILLLGLVGGLSGQIDKLLIPRLYDDLALGQTQLAIYSASYKLAIIMVLFSQAFRYAYDPFVFARAREGGEMAKATYAEAMKYYVLFALLIYLSVMSGLEVIKHLITPEYYAGLVVVPLVMAGQLMFGIYSNLSLWYKLTDRTIWGGILSVVGCALMVAILLWGVPRWGYIAAGWASVVSSGVMMTLSYLLGRRYYPVPYPTRRLGGYALLVAGLVGLEWWVSRLVGSTAISLLFNALVVGLFVGYVLWREGLLMRLTPLLDRLRHRPRQGSR